MAVQCTRLGSTVAAMYTGGGVHYMVHTPNQGIYCFFINSSNAVRFVKSLDGGVTWGKDSAASPTSAVTQLSVWYDKWSGLSSGLIHLATVQSNVADTTYRTIDTENSDALSTPTDIHLGTSTATGGCTSIARSRGGDVYCRTVIDAGAEGGFYRLTNANVPNGAWGALTINETLATQDQMILLPGWAADDQDMIGIFWDASANEISRQLYDASAGTWSETSIATSMTDVPASTSSWPHYYAAVDIDNSEHVLIAWSAADTLNADLRCWTITESAITAKTDVVLNSVDDQGYAALGINTDTGHWHAFYAGKSDGSETYTTNMNIWMKISTDSGATWGLETAVTSGSNVVDFDMRFLTTMPRFTGEWGVAFKLTTAVSGGMELVYARSKPGSPRAQVILGV